MPSKPHTFPVIKAIMVSFDMLPKQDTGLVRMAQYDLSRMKGVARQKKAISMSKAFRVSKSEKQIRIEFLDTAQPEEKLVKLRFIYELVPPFGRA